MYLGKSGPRVRVKKNMYFFFFAFLIFFFFFYAYLQSAALKAHYSMQEPAPEIRAVHQNCIPTKNSSTLVYVHA